MHFEKIMRLLIRLDYNDKINKCIKLSKAKALRVGELNGHQVISFFSISFALTMLYYKEKMQHSQKHHLLIKNSTQGNNHELFSQLASF